MRKLLWANLFRLGRSRCFWISAGVMALISLALTLMMAGETYEVLLERAMFQSLGFYGIVTAAFVSLFLGAEYGDGAVRNKLAAGSSRNAVYLSGWMAASAGGVLLYGAAVLTACAAGVPLLETRSSPLHFLTAAALGLLGCFVYCSLYSILVMLCQNKAAGAVCCLSAAVFLLGLALFVNLRLAQPQFEQVIQEGRVVEAESPYYLTGLRREIFEVLQLLNPAGQAANITMLKLERPAEMAACSLGLLALSSAAGTALFRRRDLK